MIIIDTYLFYFIRCEVRQENANLTGKQENTQTYSYHTTHRSETSISPIVNQSMICEEGFVFDHQSSDCIGIGLFISYNRALKNASNLLILVILILLAIIYFV